MLKGFCIQTKGMGNTMKDKDEHINSGTELIHSLKCILSRKKATKWELEKSKSALP